VLDSARQNMLTISRASPTNVLLPQPGAVPGEFVNGWSSVVVNIGSGTATIIPQGGALINGLASIALATGFGAIIASNGTNYFASVMNAGGVGSTIAAIPLIVSGSPISTGIVADIYVPFACTISEVTLLADTVGSVVFDIWKAPYASYPPTVANTITAAAKPTIAAANKSQDGTLTGWTTSIFAGDCLRFNIDSIATIQRVELTLKVLK